MSKEDLVNNCLSGISLAVSKLYDDAKAEGFAEGVSSVPVPTEGGLFSQEQMDKAVSDAVSAKDLENQGIIAAKQAELDKALSDDASDKAQIESQKAILSQIDGLLHPVQPQG
jgi:hypothetical protein